jgi:hypothetical protein
MDLNKLYFDHQVLVVRARHAAPGKARSSYETGARRVADSIGSIQRLSGAPAAMGWELLAALPGAALCSSLTAKEFKSQATVSPHSLRAS